MNFFMRIIYGILHIIKWGLLFAVILVGSDYILMDIHPYSPSIFEKWVKYRGDILDGSIRIIFIWAIVYVPIRFLFIGYRSPRFKCPNCNTKFKIDSCSNCQSKRFLSKMCMRCGVTAFVGNCPNCEALILP